MKGAIGEERLGRFLDGLAEGGTVSVLHDRRLPGSAANIDHLVVAPTGVWVIDAKRYSGRVEVINRGGLFGSDLRLKANGRDRTDHLVGGVHKQVRHVCEALHPRYAHVDVFGALCFVETRRRVGSRAKRIDGVWVMWQRDLRRRLSEDGPLDEAWRASIQHHLARSFGVAG